MRLQLLSDLHAETESVDPVPADGAELLVLAGDIDTTWSALDRFRGWPVPVVMVAGNHEFDRRDIRKAWTGLRQRTAAAGIRLLECDEHEMVDRAGRRIRMLGTVRWCDFDLYGPTSRERCMRASRYFVEIMRSTIDGAVFDAEKVREQALACRQWLFQSLRVRPVHPADATVVITHYGPSLKSADPRYGRQPSTASFCNADDELMPGVDLWIHGHLHCRHDYRVEHANARPTRVVSNARGHAFKGEAEGWNGSFVVDV